MIERIPLTSRDEWLADRLKFINASEIGIVCGEASYGSAAALYAEKKGLRPPQIDNTTLRRGRWGESAAFEALAEEFPEWNVKRAAIHVRDTERRLACTPDGFATAPDHNGIGIVQAKVIARTFFRQRWLDDPADSIHGPATPPTAYRLQVLTELMLNELNWGLLAVLIVGEHDWTLRLFDIERDPVLEDRIQHCAAAFLRDHLDAGVMPEFQPQRDETLIRALFPKDNGSTIDLTADNRALAAVDELIETQAALKRMRAKETEVKTELCGKLGEHTYALLGDGRKLSWKMQHRKSYVAPASDFRVLRIVNRKDETE